MYAYQGDDPEEAENLLFFLRTGVAATDGNSYLIVAQEAARPRRARAQLRAARRLLRSGAVFSDEQDPEDLGGADPAAAGHAEHAAPLDGQEQGAATPGARFPLPPLPNLPPNVRVVPRPPQACPSTYGVLGWALSSGALAAGDAAGFDYFILLDSSMRGPFLPTYWPVSTLVVV
jgi:hypothetical protein